MIYCVKYIVFCLLVLLMIVEWIFQHVQNRDKKQKQKQKKQNNNNNNKKKKQKKKRPTDPNFEVCYTSIRIFSGLKRGSWIWIFPVILFTLTLSIILPFDNSYLKKKKKRKKGCNPTNQSLRHLKTNTCTMLLYCSWGSDIAFRT